MGKEWVDEADARMEGAMDGLGDDDDGDDDDDDVVGGGGDGSGDGRRVRRTSRVLQGWRKNIDRGGWRQGCRSLATYVIWMSASREISWIPPVASGRISHRASIPRGSPDGVERTKYRVGTL